MKKVIILLSVLLVIACGAFDGYWFMTFDNFSNINPIICILDKCTSDKQVTSNSYYDYCPGGCKHVFLMDRRPTKEIKDSAVIYFLKPQSFNHKGSRFISKSEAETINNSPHLILATYIFSVQQLKALDWSFSFPPDEKMKELGVLTIPSYEDLNENYRK